MLLEFNDIKSHIISFGGVSGTRTQTPFDRLLPAFQASALPVRLKTPRVGGATSQYLVYLDQGFTSLPFGGEGGIRTLAPVTRPSGLANRPLHHLGTPPYK